MNFLIGRKVTIFYDDGQTGSKKTGVPTDFDATFLVLDSLVLIPKSRVFRIEVLS